MCRICNLYVAFQGPLSSQDKVVLLGRQKYCEVMHPLADTIVLAIYIFLLYYYSPKVSLHMHSYLPRIVTYWTPTRTTNQKYQHIAFKNEKNHKKIYKCKKGCPVPVGCTWKVVDILRLWEHSNFIKLLSLTPSHAFLGLSI